MNYGVAGQTGGINGPDMVHRIYQDNFTAGQVVPLMVDEAASASTAGRCRRLIRARTSSQPSHAVLCAASPRLPAYVGLFAGVWLLQNHCYRPDAIKMSSFGSWWVALRAAIEGASRWY